jgi:hypothetical protein
MVTAVVQSNEDGIYNDNKYEYATVCLPFSKKHRPGDLSI